MKHLILSRVNVPCHLDPKKYDDPTPYKSEQWNHHRIRLLNKYLRSSLRNQTCQNFTLITLWGKQYDWDKTLLLNERQVVITRGWDTHDEKGFDFTGQKRGKPQKATREFWKQIRDKTKPLAGELTLVTNIDSDDAVRYDFVENVQRLAQQHIEKAPFYLDCGNRYAINDRNHKTGVKSTSNVSPAPTTIETDYQALPMKWPHSIMGRHVKGKKFKELNLLQSISGANIFCRGIGDHKSVYLYEYGLQR